MPFGGFLPQHRWELQAAFQAPQWQELRHDGTLAAAARHLRTPPRVVNVFSLPVEQLKAANGPRVQQLIAEGERDEERLLAALGTWPEQWPASLPVRLSFVGANLSFACDMTPRCAYCNQTPVPQRLGSEQWRALLRSLPCSDGEGVYVYLTGGEPLLLGGDVWAAGGLIEVAGDSGAACNLNTNALALTPRAAVGMVRCGLGRLHVSLDTHRPEVGDALHRRQGRWRQIIQGLRNIQIAKAVLGAQHPVIHLNCVLTRLNAPDFADFLRFVLDMKPLPEAEASKDLDFHLIPVGGGQNGRLRLSAEGYARFFTQTWAEAEAVWQQYQAEHGIEPEKRKTLEKQMPFMSPYHRVSQRGDLGEWAERAAEGLPGALAMTQRCYVAPTQAFVLPDGSQYWCGGHAISRPEPNGNVLDRPLCDNVCQSVRQVAALPGEQCRTCPGATQAINQTVEGRLRETIREWLHPETVQPAGQEAPPADVD